MAILRQTQKIFGGVHILQHPERRHATAGEVAERVGEGVLGGPAHALERASRPARPERHEPETTILGRPEHCVGGAEPTEGGHHICRAGIRDVGADDRGPPPPEPVECAIHAPAKVAAALTDAPDPPGDGEMRPVGCHRQHCPKPSVGCQPSQQGDQRGAVKAECCPVPDSPGEPALDRAKSRSASKNDDRIYHR